MKIYVDADACPKLIKEVLYKVVNRLHIDMLLVADKLLQVPDSEYIKCLKVPTGIDSADEKIVELVEKGDLVVTADIPLADFVVTNGAFAINPRGELYTERNIKEHLSRRNMMDELRNSGIETGGPPPFNTKDKENFTNQLDKFVTRSIRLQGK